MANFTQYKKLEMPLSIEKYNVGVFNKNVQIIDSELHKLDLKNQEQDESFAKQSALNEHINDESNPHSVTKEQVGLPNVDNTADLDKPVSAEQQKAITQAFNDVIMIFATIIDQMPSYDDTLNILNNIETKESNVDNDRG